MPVDPLSGSKARVEAKKKQEGDIFYSDGIMTLIKKKKVSRRERGKETTKTSGQHLLTLFMCYRRMLSATVCLKVIVAEALPGGVHSIAGELPA